MRTVFAVATFAYIGPGAGLAVAGSFLTLLLALLSGVLLIVSWPVRRIVHAWRRRHVRRRAKARRVVVLGLDGLDPNWTERLMDEGLLPNLARLKAQGGYQRLESTWPPLSPVAWSSFACGVNPSKHGIFDFVRYRRSDYTPVISTVRRVNFRHNHRQRRLFSVFDRWELLRRSKAFWQVLSDAGIFSAVLRVPVSFPPERFFGVQLAAVSVPDLRGTQGEYTHFIDDKSTETLSHTHSGRRVLVQRRGEEVFALLPGPQHPWIAHQAEVHTPLRLSRDKLGIITLQLGEVRITLAPGEFSPWVQVSFRISRRKRLTAICRFLLQSWDAPFSLYCTPLHLDPARPAAPLASPASFARYLHARQGNYATLGVAEDMGARNDHVLSAEDFLLQAYDTHAERQRMFFDMLDRVKEGAVVCVFDAPDRIQHMHFIPTNACGKETENRTTMIDLYQRMDALVGETMARLDKNTTLLVLSDHGFQPFRRAVDLNAWLHEQGYQHWHNPPTAEQPATMDGIDWSRTRAFAFGLSGLYLNVQGREAQGIVSPGEEYLSLAHELSTKLKGLLDPASGEVAILEAPRRATLYAGPYRDDAPDLIVGYNAGFRVHWATALGGSCGEFFTDNDKPWQGDHCVHPSVVPGVLFCNRPISTEAARMIDMAPTVMDQLGVSIPAYMDGVTLLCDEESS